MKYALDFSDRGSSGAKARLIGQRSFGTTVGCTSLRMASRHWLSSRIRRPTVATAAPPTARYTYLSHEGDDDSHAPLTYPPTDFLEIQLHAPIQLSMVLMNIDMPTMDEITCACRICKAQQEGRLSKVLPIIAVSVDARSEQVKQALEAGMDAAVTKPFRIGELMPKMGRPVGEGS